MTTAEKFTTILLASFIDEEFKKYLDKELHLLTMIIEDTLVDKPWNEAVTAIINTNEKIIDIAYNELSIFG